METDSGGLRKHSCSRDCSQQAIAAASGDIELGGLDWEPGVGLISIATRNSPRRALAQPPDGEARNTRYRHTQSK